MLEPGALRTAIVERTARALEEGALISIPTAGVWVQDHGMDFYVRTVANLERKAFARREQSAGRARANPFLPYEPEMFVANLSDTHVCLLNKFNVVRRHILIVTRELEAQGMALTPADFEAMWRCLQACDGLAFYNAGENAGASQEHKHLQMVPKSEVTGGPLPIESLLGDARTTGAKGTLPRLPFAHQFAWLETGSLAGSPRTVAARLHRLYHLMLKTLDLGPGASGTTRAYNLLATRDWLLVVPRTREHFGATSINALGFAGALLIKNERDLEQLVKAGPMAALIQVGRSDSG